jgi:hypothetical protein
MLEPLEAEAIRGFTLKIIFKSKLRPRQQASGDIWLVKGREAARARV